MNINKSFLEIKDITIVFKNNKGKWQMFTDYAFNLTFIEHIIHQNTSCLEWSARRV